MKAESPHLGHSRTFTTIGLNRDGRVEASPGTTLCFVDTLSAGVPSLGHCPGDSGVEVGRASAHPVE